MKLSPSIMTWPRQTGTRDLQYFVLSISGTFQAPDIKRRIESSERLKQSVTSTRSKKASTRHSSQPLSNTSRLSGRDGRSTLFRIPFGFERG